MPKTSRSSAASRLVGETTVLQHRAKRVSHWLAGWLPVRGAVTVIVVVGLPPFGMTAATVARVEISEGSENEHCVWFLKRLFKERKVVVDGEKGSLYHSPSHRINRAEIWTAARLPEVILSTMGWPKEAGELNPCPCSFRFTSSLMTHTKLSPPVPMPIST